MDYQGLVDESKGGFEELVAKIPGYKGYKQKEWRREADKLLREKITRDLEEQRRRLTEGQIGLINAGLIKFVDDLERANMKLQILSDRVKTASYGYRGLFDAVKVKEEQLDALYRFDADLLAGVPQVAEKVDQVLKAIREQAEIAPAIDELVALAAKLNDLFSKREEAIQQSSRASL
jgi:hypothetical protein